MSERIIPIRTAPVPVAHNTEQSLGERVQRTQADARALADQHVAELRRAALNLTGLAEQIEEGGEPYLPGVREAARRLAAGIRAHAATIDAIMGRAGR